MELIKLGVLNIPIHNVVEMKERRGSVPLQQHGILKDGLVDRRSVWPGQTVIAQVTARRMGSSTTLHIVHIDHVNVDRPLRTRD